MKLTPKGLEALKTELEGRIKETREEILSDLIEARAQGDLSENADYEVARDNQQENENRIKELEEIINNHIIIKGVDVTISVNGKEKRDFTIVGTLESDPLNGLISNECPVGKAIIENPEAKELRTKSENGKPVHIVRFR